MNLHPLSRTRPSTMPRPSDLVPPHRSTPSLTCTFVVRVRERVGRRREPSRVVRVVFRVVVSASGNRRGVEPLADPRGVDRTTVGLGEHVATVDPPRTDREAVLGLPGAVSPKHGNESGRQWHGPFRCGGLAAGLDRGATDNDGRPSHGRRSPIEVNVCPSQRDGFTATHPRAEQRGPEGAGRVVSRGRREETARLDVGPERVRPHALRPRTGTRQRAPGAVRLSRVPRKVPVLDDPREDTAERTVDVPQRLRREPVVTLG